MRKTALALVLAVYTVIHIAVGYAIGREHPSPNAVEEACGLEAG